MSPIFILVLILGLLGAATFLTGFVKGLRQAMEDHRNPQPESEWTDEGRHASSAFFAVLASAVVIGLVGVNPIFIYVGPLLAIATATGVGFAFLVGTRPDAAASGAAKSRHQVLAVGPQAAEQCGEVLMTRRNKKKAYLLGFIQDDVNSHAN